MYYTATGGVAERLKAPVSKTGMRDSSRIEGSNPSPSAAEFSIVLMYLIFLFSTQGDSVMKTKPYLPIWLTAYIVGFDRVFRTEIDGEGCRAVAIAGEALYTDYIDL